MNIKQDEVNACNAYAGMKRARELNCVWGVGFELPARAIGFEHNV
jgi:hypothetical protein